MSFRPIGKSVVGDEHSWIPNDDSEGVTFGVIAAGRHGRNHGGYVTVWAGGELDPAWLTPAGARQAAEEWPAKLRELADQLENTERPEQ